MGKWTFLLKLKNCKLMNMRSIKPIVLTLLIYIFAGISMLYSQTFPAGIAYQAVARDSYGDEIKNTEIDVKFSILQGGPLGDIVYQELHSRVATSTYGVFSLIIGTGTKTGGTAASFTGVDWSTANHYLKVEVKFQNDFMDMGTMQFLAVPYALYASKSLEPGPQGIQGEPGPQGIPGDPASDNQTLSVVNIDGSDYLKIEGGNQVKVSNIEEDGDITNELQDLRLANDILTITKISDATSINLAPYSQSLSYNTGTYALAISGITATVDLSGLKNDADADPANEIQTLAYNESSKVLTISGTGGNTVTLGTEIAFRARNTSTDPSAIATYAAMTYDAVDYNFGNCVNSATGVFTAPSDGIYTFNVSYFADGSGDGREIALYVNTVLYEKIAVSITAGSTITVRSVTMRLSATNTVSFVVYTGLAAQTGTGTFSGFKVN